MLARIPILRPGSRRGRRRGAAIVEFAVVAPILVTLVLGIIEVGRLVQIAQMATNAAREGARYSAQGSADTAAVDSYLRTYLGAAGFRSAASGANSSVAVGVDTQSGGSWTSTSNPSTAASGTPVRVTVTIDFAKESWLPTQFFVGSGAKVQGVAVMRRE